MSLETLYRKIRPYIPFCVLNIVCGQIDRNAQTILDIGCGKGEPMSFINSQAMSNYEP